VTPRTFLHSTSAMPLSLDDVKRIAVLARLSVTEPEAEQALVELNGVFALIEQMRSANTKNVEPMSHAQDVMLRLRPDAVSEPDQHELFQSVAPQTEAGLYLVPKVIE
jgi:aspartyl-tRNA(Asn)/glutamyl-tRNA(Gln) amidotransferase subunit C